jgi:hypothetical protein
MECEERCPYCGEPATIWVDPGGGEEQVYVEDCSVCCRPWQVRAWLGEDGTAHVSIERLDG